MRCVLAALAALPAFLASCRSFLSRRLAAFIWARPTSFQCWTSWALAFSLGSCEGDASVRSARGCGEPNERRGRWTHPGRLPRLAILVGALPRDAVLGRRRVELREEAAKEASVPACKRRRTAESEDARWRQPPRSPASRPAHRRRRRPRRRKLASGRPSRRRLALRGARRASRPGRRRRRTCVAHKKIKESVRNVVTESAQAASRAEETRPRAVVVSPRRNDEGEQREQCSQARTLWHDVQSARVYLTVLERRPCEACGEAEAMNERSRLWARPGRVERGERHARARRTRCWRGG